MNLDMWGIAVYYNIEQEDNMNENNTWKRFSTHKIQNTKEK